MDTQTKIMIVVTAYWLCGIASLGYYHMLDELDRGPQRHRMILGAVVFVLLWPIAAAYGVGAVLCLFVTAVIAAIRRLGA